MRTLIEMMWNAVVRLSAHSKWNTEGFYWVFLFSFHPDFLLKTMTSFQIHLHCTHVCQSGRSNIAMNAEIISIIILRRQRRALPRSHPLKPPLSPCLHACLLFPLGAYNPHLSHFVCWLNVKYCAYAALYIKSFMPAR